jgi:hypothetical protein
MLSWGIKMVARRRIAWLICLAMLGVLVISCELSGSPKPDPSDPAAAGGTSAESGTGGRPGSDPESGSGTRPGGEPGSGSGTRPGGGLLELSEATGITLREWKAIIDANCVKAVGRTGCLAFNIVYSSDFKGTDKECDVNEVERPSGYVVRDDKIYVESGVTITVTVFCEATTEEETVPTEEATTEETTAPDESTAADEPSDATG